ncbi:MAG: M43 family zinc metalloprotease, partial [Rhodothermales bacterium]
MNSFPKNILLLIFATILTIPNSSWGQSGQMCSVTKPPEIASLLKERQRNRNLSASFAPINIGIAFHVIHKGGSENVDIADLENQISVLNSAFDPTDFSFFLSSFFLSSVSRTNDISWFDLPSLGAVSDTIHNTLSIDPEHLINIYIGDLPNLALGWAPFPSTTDSDKHAILLDYATLPDNSVNLNYDEGDILVHEVGHYFGLIHPWEGGCLADPTKGDEIVGTPASSSAFFNTCPSSPDSCPALLGNDAVTNYMYSTTDACRTGFIEEQFTRMDDEIGTHKPNIGGSTINIVTNHIIKSNTETTLYEGEFSFSSGTGMAVDGILNAEDIILTSSNSNWDGIEFKDGSEGTLTNVDVLKVGSGAHTGTMTIRDGADVTLKGDNIIIGPNFIAEKGSTFLAT